MNYKLKNIVELVGKELGSDVADKFTFKTKGGKLTFYPINNPSWESYFNSKQGLVSDDELSLIVRRVKILNT
jgi:hypothetical protein